MRHNYETMQIEARNLQTLWERAERQFTAEFFDRQLAERSYDWFEGAVEQFMVDATEAGMLAPIRGPKLRWLGGAANEIHAISPRLSFRGSRVACHPLDRPLGQGHSFNGRCRPATAIDAKPSANR